MATVREITAYLEELAPMALKLDFDNVGLLVGTPEKPVSKVLVALDITVAVIDEAAAFGAELIVSHHPLFLEGLKSIVDTDVTGGKVARLLTHGISAVCMHTNLDAAPGGVNDVLAEKLGTVVTEVLNEDERISRIAELPEEIAFQGFLKRVCAVLQSSGLRYYDAGHTVRRIGVCGGSGGQDLEAALRKNCDTFVTADVKYHQFLLAGELGINLIDAGHFATENVIVPVLAEKLSERFKGELLVKISQAHGRTAQFYVPDETGS